MNRALQIAHLVLLIAATALIGAAAWRGILLARDIDALVNSTNAALGHVNGPTGTIAETDKLLLALKSTTVHVDMAARHEDQQLGALDAQEHQVFADLHATMSATDATLASLQGTARGATALLGAANGVIAVEQPRLDGILVSTASLVDHGNALAADPAIPATLDNTAKITSDAARITKDAADEADRLAHPQIKKMGFWGTADAVLLYIHSHIAPPIF